MKPTSAYVSIEINHSLAIFKKTEYPHITLGWYSLDRMLDVDSFIDKLIDMGTGIAARQGPFLVGVSGWGVLGPEKVDVLLVESEEVQSLKDYVDETMPAPKVFPHFVPHVTYENTMEHSVPSLLDAIGVRVTVFYSDGSKKDEMRMAF